MKVEITKEEWWPVYSLDQDTRYATPTSPMIEIPKRVWVEYVEAYNKFQIVQTNLAKLYKKNTE